VFSAVSLIGVDKAQAAVLTYNIDDGSGSDLSYFKVNDSSLTGIGEEYIRVSEGKFYGYTLRDFGYLVPGAKEYYDLAGGPYVADVAFYQGEFRGLRAVGSDYVILDLGDPQDEFYEEFIINWYMSPYPGPTGGSRVSGASQRIYYPSQDIQRRIFTDDEVYFTLVDTAPEPVPEPLTAGGTALALAGLSWLKHKKKMAA
jgi:hypothetical protein